MTHNAYNPEAAATEQVSPEEILAEELERKLARERMVHRLRVLWERRKTLMQIAGLGLLAGGAIAFAIPKRFDSTTRLMPPDSQSNASMAALAAASNRLGGGLAGLGSEVLGVKTNGALFLGIIESRTIQDALVERSDLRRVYGVSRTEAASRKLAGNTSATEDKKSGIISIRVTANSPEQAAAMATEYVDELNRVVNQLSTSSAHREREFLEERLKAVEQDLGDAEKQFSQFASKNTAIDIKEQGRAMVEAAATLQGQLIAAESELEGLRQIYADSNVRVRSVRARISELKNQLERIGGKNEGGTSSGESQGDSMYPSIRRLPLLGVTYADLYRRTKVEEAVFETLTQEYELAKVEEVKETPSVKVLDPANIPERKSFPPRLLISLAGSGASLLLGVAWILGTAAWNEFDPRDPRKVFVQEVFAATMAVIPAAATNGSSRRKLTGAFLRILHRGDVSASKQ